jgi:hypothetical protein
MFLLGITKETFEKCPILSQFKAAARFKPEVPAKPMPCVVNTLSISRIARKLHCVPKFELNAEIGQKRVFFKGLIRPADKSSQ